MSDSTTDADLERQMNEMLGSDGPQDNQPGGFTPLSDEELATLLHVPGVKASQS